MTKVEELLQEINDTLEDTANSLNPCFHRDFIGLDDVLVDLISAAHAEGVVEGAEQERERIRGESQMVGVDSESVNFIGSVDNYVGAAFLVPVDVMDPPASVLVPTKESEK